MIPQRIHSIIRNLVRYEIRFLLIVLKAITNLNFHWPTEEHLFAFCRKSPRVLPENRHLTILTFHKYFLVLQCSGKFALETAPPVTCARRSGVQLRPAGLKFDQIPETAT